MNPLKLLPKTVASLTVLCFDGRWLKLAQATGPQFARTITMLLAHSVEGQSDEEILAWLRAACAERGFQPGPILIANPSQLTTTRVFSLPSTNPAEIRDIVELQAEKHTPYAKDEILSDFQILETDQAGYSRVLLVLSHQEIVHRALRLVEGMGWTLERVGFELEGLIGWCRMTHQPSTAGPALVIELDREASTLAIVHEGRTYFHRGVAIGLDQLHGEAETAPARFIEECQRSVEAFEAEGLSLAPASVVLTGQAVRAAGLAETMQKGMSLPVSVVEQFERCPLSPAMAKAQAELPPVSFAGLIGLALNRSDVDLTPKALKVHRAFEVRAKAVVTLGCQVMAALVLISCILVAKAQRQERYHAALLRQYAAIDAERQQMTFFLDQLGVIRSWNAQRGRLLEVVKAIAERTPAAVEWNALTYTKDEQVSLKGVSDEMPQVYNFTGELKPVPLFSEVEARRVTKKRVNDENRTEFEIVGTLVKPDEEHGEETDLGG